MIDYAQQILQEIRKTSSLQEMENLLDSRTKVYANYITFSALMQEELRELSRKCLASGYADDLKKAIGKLELYYQNEKDDKVLKRLLTVLIGAELMIDGKLDRKERAEYDARIKDLIRSEWPGIDIRNHNVTNALAVVSAISIIAFFTLRFAPIPGGELLAVLALLILPIAMGSTGGALTALILNTTVKRPAASNFNAKLNLFNTDKNGLVEDAGNQPQVLVSKI